MPPRTISILLTALLLLAPSILRAQDMPLSMFLDDRSKWEIVSKDHAFTDATCSDEKGNFHFADVKEGDSFFRVDAAGKVAPLFGGAEGVSGAQFGPDGRIYACQPRLKRVVAFDGKGAVTVLAKDVAPNDLVVTHKGVVYFTETRTRQVTRIDPGGGVHSTATSAEKPNGITLSADQKYLAVSDHGGEHVWFYRIAGDGRLYGEQAYMTMKTPPGTEVARGDGMATDDAGRYYVTTALGVQVFDPAGRLSAIIPAPYGNSIVSVAFAGPGLKYLHVACGDRVYRRLTKTVGILFSRPPAKNP